MTTCQDTGSQTPTSNDDPIRSLGVFKLEHRVIIATYIGDGASRLDLVGIGGNIIANIGAITGINTPTPRLTAHPTQRQWVDEPAATWFLTKTTCERYRTTPIHVPRSSVDKTPTWKTVPATHSASSSTTPPVESASLTTAIETGDEQTEATS